MPKGPGEDPAVEEFAALVRALKARDGRSYEALGRRLGVSASTLHRYCSGESVPESFAVAARLAALCGAGEEERRALEEAWVRADLTRRPPAPAPVPEPVPEPETEPVPVPEAEPAPEPPRQEQRPRRRWPTLVAVVPPLALAVAAALALGAVLRPPGTEEAAPTPPPPPLTWTAASHVWQNDCGHTYLVDRAPDRVPAPPPAAEARRWATAQGAVHGGETLVRVSVQGKGASAVVLQGLHVRVVGRATPLPWPAYRMDEGCGGAVTPRLLAVDLDRPRPVARPVDGYDASGAEGRRIPAVAFPYKVTAAEPEELLVSARTAGCDCRWYLEMEWSSEGRSGTVAITDPGGRPFRTSGTEKESGKKPGKEAGKEPGRTYAYDSTVRRWITVQNSGQFQQPVGNLG